MPKKRIIPKGHKYIEDKLVKEVSPQRKVEMVDNNTFKNTMVEDYEAEPVVRNELPRPTPQKKKKVQKTKLLIDITTQDLDDFKVICQLLGKTQKEIVERAMRKYLAERRELLRPFLELRRQGLKDYNTEVVGIRELEAKSGIFDNE